MFPGTTGLSAGLNAVSESQLQNLLAATAQAGSGNAVWLTNETGQVLGVASQPGAEDQAQLQNQLSNVAGAMPGVTVTGVPLVAVDPLAALQAARAAQQEAAIRSATNIKMNAEAQQERLQAQLDKQNDYLESVDRANRPRPVAEIEAVRVSTEKRTRLNKALNSVRSYVDSPNPATYSTATAAVRDADVLSDPFLDASAKSAVTAAPALSARLKGLIDTNEKTLQTDLLRLQSWSNTPSEPVDLMPSVLTMQTSRSSIIGNMRSEPVALGTVQWDSGAVTGDFDLTAVPNGSHHLILNYADLGVTIIAEVDVQRGTLAATGVQTGAAPAIGLGLMLVGLAGVIGGPFLRRRGPRPATA